jgi:transposase-like protein
MARSTGDNDEGADDRQCHKKQHGESAAAARQAVEVITLMNHVAPRPPGTCKKASFAAGSSVSTIARQYDVNANQVFGWRKLYRDEPRAPAVLSAPQLIPVASRGFNRGGVPDEAALLQPPPRSLASEPQATNDCAAQSQLCP